jgi:hypothetical protein
MYSRNGNSLLEISGQVARQLEISYSCEAYNVVTYATVFPSGSEDIIAGPNILVYYIGGSLRPKAWSCDVDINDNLGICTATRGFFLGGSC